MKINKSEFLKVLNAVKPGLAGKEIIEQSASFIFQDSQAITFNDEIAVHHPLPDGLDITGAVPAKELIAILSRFKQDEVELILTDNELQLKCGKSKAGIKLEAEITLPMDELIIPTDWKKLPSDFNEGLKACAPSAAKDMTHPILTAINLDKKFACSSDDIRITHWKWIKGSTFDAPVLLPASTVSGILHANVTDYNADSSWIHFTNKEGVVFSCRVLDGEYPDITPHLEVESLGELVFPEAMTEILDRAGVFLSGTIDSDNSVSILIDSRGLMIVKGEGEFGWYEETCRTVWKGEATGFTIHPSHLQSILKTSNKCIIGVDKIKFVTEQMAHVVALEVDWA